MLISSAVGGSVLPLESSFFNGGLAPRVCKLRFSYFLHCPFVCICCCNLLRTPLAYAIRTDQISHRSDISPKMFEKFPSPIFRFFDGFSRNIDLSTYINRFFSILAPRRLSMSQIRWLRPYFMTIFRFQKMSPKKNKTGDKV